MEKIWVRLLLLYVKSPINIFIKGVAFNNLKIDKEYYPTIGLHSPNETVHLNFGQSPFAFNINNFIQVT